MRLVLSELQRTRFTLQMLVLLSTSCKNIVWMRTVCKHEGAVVDLGQYNYASENKRKTPFSACGQLPPSVSRNSGFGGHTTRWHGDEWISAFRMNSGHTFFPRAPVGATWTDVGLAWEQDGIFWHVRPAPFMCSRKCSNGTREKVAEPKANPDGVFEDWRITTASAKQRRTRSKERWKFALFCPADISHAVTQYHSIPVSVVQIRDEKRLTSILPAQRAKCPWCTLTLQHRKRQMFFFVASRTSISNVNFGTEVAASSKHQGCSVGRLSGILDATTRIFFFLQ